MNLELKVTDQPDSPTLRARCGLADAICLVARQPLVRPEDPCSAAPALDGLPLMQRSRWLLTFLPVLRALADHKGEDSPSPPESWRKLEPQLGLRSSCSLWEFELEEIWRGRVDAMIGHCDASGLEPGAWAVRWAPYEPIALAHFEACEHRNESLLHGAEVLREAAMRHDGPLMCGRDARTGVFAEIPRPLLYDPRSQWELEPGARLYENGVVFTGRLRTPAHDYHDVTFAAADIQALARGGPAHAQLLVTAKGKGTKRAAVGQAALAVFPNGLPLGLPAKLRNERIRAKILELGGGLVSERTIRAALAALWRR